MFHHHSAVYQFRFYSSLQTSWITGRSGVTLSVTGTEEYIKSAHSIILLFILSVDYILGCSFHECLPVFSDLQVKEGAVVGKQNQTDLKVLFSLFVEVVVSKNLADTFLVGRCISINV